jgi:hypothetical protein
MSTKGVREWASSSRLPEQARSLLVKESSGRRSATHRALQHRRNVLCDRRHLYPPGRASFRGIGCGHKSDLPPGTVPSSTSPAERYWARLRRETSPDMTSGLAARTSKSNSKSGTPKPPNGRREAPRRRHRMRTVRSKTQAIEGNHAPQLRRTKHRNSARTKRDSSASFHQIRTVDSQASALFGFAPFTRWWGISGSH